MRWKQKTYTRSNIVYVETYETISPFRKFTQNPNETRSYWVLPDGVDKLVETMEKARLDKNWKVSDTIRKSLTDIGIVVRNGVDWYPTLYENEVLAENVEKLKARYPGGDFDPYYSENRKEGDL